MEATRRWIQTLALTALAIAALSFTLRPEGDAHAARPGSSTCQEFIPAEGVGSLSVMDPIRMWMDGQLNQDRTHFIVVNPGPQDRASVVCAW